MVVDKIPWFLRNPNKKSPGNLGHSMVFVCFCQCPMFFLMFLQFKKIRWNDGKTRMKACQHQVSPIVFFEIFRSQKPSGVGFSYRVLQRFSTLLRFSIALRDDHVPKKQLRTCHSSSKKLKFMGTGLDHVGVTWRFHRILDYDNQSRDLGIRYLQTNPCCLTLLSWSLKM